MLNPVRARRRVVTLLVCSLFGVFAAPAGASPFAYITHSQGVSVIDTATQTVVATVPIGPETPHAVAVTPNGAHVYMSAGGKVVVVGTATNTVIATIPMANNSSVAGIAVKPSGDFAYVAVNGGPWISVIDTATNAITATIPWGASPPNGVAFTPDGSKLYVANGFPPFNPGTDVSVIDTATNTVTGTISVGDAPTEIGIAPNGARAYVAHRGGIPRRVSVIDTSTDTVVATIALSQTPFAVAFTTDSTRAYVTQQNDRVAVIDTATNTIVTSVPVGSSPIGIAATPDGTQMYVANSSSNNVSIIDTATNTVVGTVAVGTGPVALGRFIGPPLPAVCGNSSVESGEQCDDGNTTGGDCCSATCQFEASAAPCTDNNPCTDDQCDGAGTCVHANNTNGCDDGLFCNGTDTCSGGACTTHQGNPCTTGGECADNCNEGANNCFDANTTPCTDDGNLCTNDRCDGAGACGHPPNTAPCDDGLFCNGPDTCAGGSCSSHGPAPCPGPDGDANCAESCDEAIDSCTAPDPNGSACDDTLFCSVNDACQAGSCTGTSRDCSAAGDQCRIGTCDEETDQCVGPLKPDGSACDDTELCTTGDVCTAGSCAGTLDPSACIDHYLCYKTKATSPFTTLTVTLVDQFGPRSVEVQKPKALCLPANKNSEGVLDSVTHEASYQIKPAVKPTPVGNLLVADQFGTLRVDALKPDRLLVPTTKGLGSPPAPPAPGVADHYQCYKVKVTTGTTKFPKGVQAMVVDQFQTRVYDVKKPRRLCNPVDKNGEGIERPAAHLLCYQVKPATGQPKHVRVVGQIHTQNQFGAGQLDTLKEEELCVPAVKTP